MTYNEFKSILWIQGIDSDIVEACREFIIDENKWCLRRSNENRYNKSDLGFAELADYTDLQSCVEELKNSIRDSILDFDALGRSREKVLLKQLKKNPHKHIKRIMLKAYYLCDGQA